MSEPAAHNFNLDSGKIKAYNCKAVSVDGKDALHCELKMPIEILEKIAQEMDYLLLYPENTVQEFNHNNNVDIRCYADLKTDGTGMLTMCQFDLKKAMELKPMSQTIEDSAKQTKAYNACFKGKVSCGLSRNDIDAVKAMINTAHALEGIALTADDVLKAMKKSEKSKSCEKMER